MAKRRILVVDDEVGFTKLLKLNLEKDGQYEVRIENDGVKAVDSAREFQPDLILLDIIMPEKDGGEVLADLQREPSLKNVRVLFLTATVSIKGVEQRDGTIRGMPFVGKPVEPKRLVKRIEEILNS
ncbi:MAG: response regulator [Verrucomicrobia bacterium]|nr:response regulator [Verrucomicrobiota bacterium]